MKYYLTHGSTPKYMEPKKKRALRLKSAQYHLTQGLLFITNYDGVFLRLLEKEDAKKSSLNYMIVQMKEILGETLQHKKSLE
jgi:hypothetical protein